MKKLFTETAEVYAGLFLEKRTGKNYGFRERLRIAVELARGSSGSLLDCATGSGEITSAILAEGQFRTATLVDQSPTMIELARSRIQDGISASRNLAVDFVCDDLFRFMPACELRFDLVLCLGLIAHTGRLSELLEGARRLLTPDGSILLQTTLDDHPGAKIERLLSGERYFRRHGYRYSHFSHSDIREACLAAGLEIRSCRRHALGIPYGDKIWAWGNYQLERLCHRLTAVCGAEALYLLKPRREA